MWTSSRCLRVSCQSCGAAEAQLRCRLESKGKARAVEVVSPELPHPHSHMTPRQAAGVWFVKEVRIQPEFFRHVIASGMFTCDL